MSSRRQVGRRTLAAAIVLSVANTGFAVAGVQPIMAEIMLIGADFCPKGWLPTNGQLLPISQNTALFSLLQFRYGGDGQTTFALPLAPPIFTADHRQILSCIAVQGIFPTRP
jgi:microcystin-dependent protein